MDDNNIGAINLIEDTLWGDKSYEVFVLGYDGKDEGALDRRMAVRADHFKNVQSVKDRGGNVRWSDHILSWNLNREKLVEYLETEPYVVNRVWQEVKVENVKVAIFNDEKVK